MINGEFRYFVRFVNFYPVQLPVGPIKRVFEQRKRMRMEQIVTSGDNLLTTGPVIITKVDKVQFGIGKIHALVDNVQRQTVGPINLCAYDDRTVSAVHTDTFDSRVFSPVGPK